MILYCNVAPAPKAVPEFLVRLNKLVSSIPPNRANHKRLVLRAFSGIRSKDTLSNRTGAGAQPGMAMIALAINRSDLPSPSSPSYAKHDQNAHVVGFRCHRAGPQSLCHAIFRSLRYHRHGHAPGRTLSHNLERSLLQVHSLRPASHWRPALCASRALDANVSRRRASSHSCCPRLHPIRSRVRRGGANVGGLVSSLVAPIC